MLVQAIAFGMSQRMIDYGLCGRLSGNGWRFFEIAERPWFRAFIFVWGAVGARDLVLSQFVPEEYSRNFPKLYRVIGMTAGWLPLWTWLMVGALSLVADTIEWAFRHKKRYLELLRRGPTESGDRANLRGIVGDHPLIGNPGRSHCNSDGRTTASPCPRRRTGRAELLVAHRGDRRQRARPHHIKNKVTAGFCQAGDA
jgi:hypothetical protein